MYYPKNSFSGIKSDEEHYIGQTRPTTWSVKFIDQQQLVTIFRILESAPGGFSTSFSGKSSLDEPRACIQATSILNNLRKPRPGTSFHDEFGMGFVHFATHPESNV